MNKNSKTSFLVRHGSQAQQYTGAVELSCHYRCRIVTNIFFVFAEKEENTSVKLHVFTEYGNCTLSRQNRHNYRVFNTRNRQSTLANMIFFSLMNIKVCHSPVNMKTGRYNVYPGTPEKMHQTEMVSINVL